MSGEIRGYIHSTESLGTVDGPGLRFVVFMSGCPMRCAYCHNPDTWEPKRGTLMTVREIMRELDSVREFLRGGGLTCTGGEPLMQAEFLAELFAAAKSEGVHTCLDTSGIIWEERDKHPLIDRVLDNTDLVMLDIKHIDPAPLAHGQRQRRDKAVCGAYRRTGDRPLDTPCSRPGRDRR